MFVEEGCDKKRTSWWTERQIFEDIKTKKQIYNTYFERQKDIKDRLWTETGEDRKTERTGFIYWVVMLLSLLSRNHKIIWG